MAQNYLNTGKQDALDEFAFADLDTDHRVTMSDIAARLRAVHRHMHQQQTLKQIIPAPQSPLAPIQECLDKISNAILEEQQERHKDMDGLAALLEAGMEKLASQNKMQASTISSPSPALTPETLAPLLQVLRNDICNDIKSVLAPKLDELSRQLREATAAARQISDMSKFETQCSAILEALQAKRNHLAQTPHSNMSHAPHDALTALFGHAEQTDKPKMQRVAFDAEQSARMIAAARANRSKAV